MTPFNVIGYIYNGCIRKPATDVCHNLGNFTGFVFAGYGFLAHARSSSFLPHVSPRSRRLDCVLT